MSEGYELPRGRGYRLRAVGFQSGEIVFTTEAATASALAEIPSCSWHVTGGLARRTSEEQGRHVDTRGLTPTRSSPSEASSSQGPHHVKRSCLCDRWKPGTQQFPELCPFHGRGCARLRCGLASRTFSLRRAPLQTTHGIFRNGGNTEVFMLHTPFGKPFEFPNSRVFCSLSQERWRWRLLFPG